MGQNMLITDITGLRRLYESSPRKYGFIKVCVKPRDSVKLPVFTGKFVKSFLIEAGPKLGIIFEIRVQPKPIAITTLYRVFGDKRKFLWKIAGSNKVFVAKAGEKLFFNIGCSEDVLSIILDTLTSIGSNGVSLFNTKWFLEEIEFTYYNLPIRENESIPEDFRVDNKKSIKVEFRTPILLLDPFKKSRKRRFLPTPANVFSYNIGDLLRLERNQEYFNTVILIEAILNETYNVLKTAKPVKYVYENKELPGLTGYVKYIIDWDLVNTTNSKLLLENILIHASIMGIGSSRANGFGYVTIKVE